MTGFKLSSNFLKHKGSNRIHLLFQHNIIDFYFPHVKKPDQV